MRIDVWSDFVCPFCYMGEALLQQALTEHEGAEPTIRYHSFQLMPDLPPETALSPTELLVRERGMAPEQAAAANAQVTERARTLGLEYRLDRAVATNTRTAHRLSHLAAAQGRQRELVQRLFAAYFTEGRHLGDPDTLAQLAAEAGLDRAAAAAVVTSQDYADQVDADIEQARELGITGVPFFVFDGRLAVSGAQPVEVFRQALRNESE